MWTQVSSNRDLQQHFRFAFPHRARYSKQFQAHRVISQPRRGLQWAAADCPAPTLHSSRGSTVAFEMLYGRARRNAVRHMLSRQEVATMVRWDPRMDILEAMEDLADIMETVVEDMDSLSPWTIPSDVSTGNKQEFVWIPNLIHFYCFLIFLNDFHPPMFTSGFYPLVCERQSRKKHARWKSLSRS